MSKKPWQGRFRHDTSDVMERFSQSVSFDKRLYRQDIEGSIAHARMLGERGIIPKEDACLIIEGLENIRHQIEDDSFNWDPSLEDVHMNIESALTRQIGDAGSRLHTSRSRNDQVGLDFRMYLREEARRIRDLLVELLRVIIEKAGEYSGTFMPGYTHLQRAQPILLSHHLMAYFEMFRRDHGRLAGFMNTLSASPLGSGALAGTSFPIDREMTANELGFSEVSRNSMDAVSDRDFVAEFLFAAALCQIHLSRLAEEIILWASTEFSFVALPDSYSTGSSMMPQKKNPDSAELIRGKTGRMIGNLTSLLVTLKGLPMAYNRDLQEDKEPTFDSVDTLSGSLEVMAGLLAGSSFDRERLETATVDGFITATDLADYLVQKGVPFRNAHEITGKIVRDCLDKGRVLSQMSVDELRTFSEYFNEDALEILTVQASLDKKDVPGGTAPARVQDAMEEARAFLAQIDTD